MPRIRKGNNLLAKGHVRVHSAFAAGIGSVLKQGLPPGGGGVDYKSVFDSIRTRVTGTSSSEGTVQTPGGHDVSGPRENGTGARFPAGTTDVDLLESGLRDGREAVESAAAAVKLEPSAVHTAVEVEGKQNRKDATTPPATIRGREGSSAQQASDVLRHLIKDTTATILSLCASAVPGYSRAHDSRASSVKRGRPSDPVDLNVMAQADDDSQSPPRRSSDTVIMSTPDDGGKVLFVKRRKVEENEISGTEVKEAEADAAGKQADAAGISGGNGGWSCDSRLSPHLKRPRTPHHSRSFGTTGRFSKKKPRMLHVSTAERLWEDAFGRKDEAKHAATVSLSEQEQLGGPRTAVADVTRIPAVAQSTDATHVERRDAEELIVEMGPVVKMKVDHNNDGRDLDHPSNKPIGSLLHSLYLAFYEAGSRGLTVRDAVLKVGNKDVPELGALSAAEVRKELQLSPYFIEVEEGRFFLCSSLPEKRDDEESPSAGYGHSPDEVKGASVANGMMEKLQVHSYREGCPVGRSDQNKHQNKQEESLTPGGMSQGSLQEYLQQRNSQVVWERVTRDHGIQYKSEGSYDSETTGNTDSENDADFDVRAESSGATTLTDGHLSSDDDRIMSQELTHTVKRPVRRAAPAGDSATARENRYRHLLDSLTEDQRSSGGKQCARTDGRRWQCPLRAKGGYSLCEHHLSKFRMKKAYAALQRRAVVEGLIPDKKRSRSASSVSASPSLPPTSPALPPTSPALPPASPALPPASPALPPTSPALPPNSLSQQRRSAEEESDPGKEHQDTVNVGYSTHLNSRGHRKTVKNRSLMSMY